MNRDNPGPEQCIPGCAEHADVYPHGLYCPRHARMMAPRSQWHALGVPYPEGQQPPPAAAPPRIDKPVKTWAGLPGWFGVMVVYAPCPRGCGRPTCSLPGEVIPPCLTCELSQGRAA